MEAMERNAPHATRKTPAACRPGNHVAIPKRVQLAHGTQTAPVNRRTGAADDRPRVAEVCPACGYVYWTAAAELMEP